MSAQPAPVLPMPGRTVTLSDADRRAIVDELRQALAGAPLREIARAVVREVAAELRPMAHKRDMPLNEVAAKLGKHASTIRKWARARSHGFSIVGHAGREMIIRLPEGVML